MRKYSLMIMNNKLKKKKIMQLYIRKKNFLVIFYICAFLFQGIRFVAFVHESRALTENKEIKDDD